MLRKFRKDLICIIAIKCCAYFGKRKVNKKQSPQNDTVRSTMKSIQYASVVKSLMYAQTFALTLVLMLEMSGRYQSNP